MKVIHINTVYKEGSTGKIIDDLCKHNKEKDIQCYTLYGLGKNKIDNKSLKVLNKFTLYLNVFYTYMTGYMYKGSYLATLKVIKTIKKENPDVVHLHSINGHMVNIYKLLNFLKSNDIPTVITNHGEFYYTGSYTHIPEGSTQYQTGEKENYPNAKKLTNSFFFDKTYQAIHKMEKAFKGFNRLIVTSVSPWVNKRSKESFVLKNFKHIIVLNGIDTKYIFYPRDTKELKEELGFKDEKVVLHVTSGFNNPLKGSTYMLQLAESFIGENYKFIFIGLDNNVVLPENSINIGKVYDQQKLAEYYSLADVTVITSKMETFNMIVAESLSCGTPVVGFKAGGPESITIDEYSDFVDFGDVKALKEKVIKRSNETYENIHTKGHKRYDKDIMAEKYIEVYKKVIEMSDKNV